jgi:hypothetical protein
MCISQEKETVLHHFWNCESTQTLWAFSNRLLKLLASQDARSDWIVPDWFQFIFASSIPRCFVLVGRTWSLIRGITLWCIWIERNLTIFNQGRWRSTYTCTLIWKGLMEYTKTAFKRITKEPAFTDKMLKKFNANWGRFKQLCIRSGRSMTWAKHCLLEGIG